MTTWSTGSTETLVLVWSGGGAVYMASGMEQTGEIIATTVPNISTPERPALIQFEDALVLGFMGSDNQVHFAISYDGQTFPFINTWTAYGGVPIPPDIGGPALVEQGPSLWVAGTSQGNQDLMLGFNVNTLPELIQYSQILTPQSIDTPALGVTPAGQLQLAFTGVDPTNYLTLQPDPDAETLTPAVVYPDQCYGGPTIATTVNGYAAAYVNFQNNIVLLTGLENASPANVTRTVLQDTSSHAPAVATINGVTYVAWMSVDQSTANGLIYFADLGTMEAPPTCAVSQVLQMEAGARAGEMATRLRRLRDTTLAADPSGRILIAVLDQHSDELTGLVSSEPELRHQVWDLLRQSEAIATSADGGGATFSGELIDAAQDVLARIRALASPSLRESTSHLDLLLPAMRGRTLAEGLAAVTMPGQD